MAAYTPATEPSDSWGELPLGRTAIDALATGRVDPAVALSPERIRGAVSEAIATVSARWIFADIAAEFPPLADGQRVVLIGTHHDAGAHVDAFRELVTHLAGQRRLVTELFQNRGRWDHPAAQRDEQDDLTRFFAGDDAAWRRLAERQHQRNYTAWKYDYLSAVSHLLLATRASGHRLDGCEPPSLSPSVTADIAAALRDLHCARIIGTDSVFAFYGSAHLQPDRLPQFLPRDARLQRIFLMGGRRDDEGLALRAVTPLLVPLERDVYVLLLPAGGLAAEVDRVRPSVDTRNVALRGHGTLALGNERLRLDGEQRLPPRAAAFRFDGDDGSTFVGGIGADVITLDFLEPGVVRIESGPPAGQP